VYWLYEEAVKLGWIQPSEDAKLRFLTICHHVATAKGLHNPKGALIKRVKDGLDVGAIPHASEEWARHILKRNERRAK